jgi:hypothetical protein
MERAITYAPFPTSFPVAKTAPVWRTHTLQYAQTGGYYSPSSSSAPEKTETNADNGSDGFVQIPDQP